MLLVLLSRKCSSLLLRFLRIVALKKTITLNSLCFLCILLVFFSVRFGCLQRFSPPFLLAILSPFHAQAFRRRAFLNRFETAHTACFPLSLRSVKHPVSSRLVPSACGVGVRREGHGRVLQSGGVYRPERSRPLQHDIRDRDGGQRYDGPASSAGLPTAEHTGRKNRYVRSYSAPSAVRLRYPSRSCFF